MDNGIALLVRRVVKNRLTAFAPAVKRRCVARLRAVAYCIAGGMGDGIMALPTLVFLKKQLPAALIDVHVPAAHRVMLAALLQPFRVVPAGIGSGRFLRYDIILSNTVTAFRVGYELRSRFTGRFCAGFRYPDEPPDARLYDLSLPLAASEHDIDQNLTLASRALGVPLEEGDHVLQPASSFVTLPPLEQRRSVVIHPGAGRGYDHKKWPFERYVEVAKLLVLKGLGVTVLLGPQEGHLYPFFSNLPGVTLRSVRGPEPLLAALRASRLFIGNDSGPAHCAALLGIPAVTIFGPTSAARTAPRGRGCVAIENALPCAPCHFSRAPCRDNQCLKSISVEQVWSAVEQTLARDRA